MIGQFRYCRAHRLAALLLALAGLLPVRAAEVYYPGPGELWEKRAADAVGMNADRLAEAVKFAQAHEVNWLRDMRAQIERDVAHEPYSQLLGETKDRGGPTGIIVRYGYIVAEWGDTHRVEMSFGIAESYLSVLVGLALERGLIKDIHDPVWKYVTDGGFDSAHNTPITWHMLLNQTSEWEGMLWGKPDIADRRRGYGRNLHEPGTFWEYNDVRVNRLALSLLRVWNQPLPQVLQEQIMDPIGASHSWVWHGYRTSFVDIERARCAIGQRRQPLGRRIVGERPRPCALRLSVPAWRQLERSPACFQALDPDGNAAHGDRPAVWLSVVAQHRTQDFAGGG